MDRYRHRGSGGSELVAALGLVFVLGGVVLWWESLLPASGSVQGALHELVMHVLFGGVILALGVHLERSDLDPADRFAVMAWCFSGFVFLLALAVWGHAEALVAGGVTLAFVSDVLVLGSMGGAFGVIAGVNHGRATRNARLADRVEDQRETLVLLTRLLRHDIRNDMNVILGNAERLSAALCDRDLDPLDVIRHRSEAIVRLLSDTDALVETLDGPREFERTDLSRVLRAEVAGVADSNPEVRFRTEIPHGLTVIADGLVHQLFSNLLENAVAHNDPEGLTVRVEAVDRGDAVEVVVADDGVGIPAELREDCFELGEQGTDSSGDGLGLYLVSRLADVYGGGVELGESDGGGARFQVTLPAATAAASGG